MYKIITNFKFIKDGVPVVDKQAKELIKILDVNPKDLNITFPRKNSWKVSKEINIKNKSDYTVHLDSLKIGENIPNLNGELSNNEIKPRDETNVTINFSARKTGEKVDNKKYAAKINANIENINQQGLIALGLSFNQEKSLKSKIITFIVSFTILLIVLIIIGLTVIIPKRVRNKTYESRSHGQYNLLGELQASRGFKPYVIIEDVKIGITLFGYGYWYTKDLETGIKERGLKNIFDITSEEDIY